MRVESGHETTFNELFDLPPVISEATTLYKYEAQCKGLRFEIYLACDLRMVFGDSSKVRAVVANLAANARKTPPFLIFTYADHVSCSEIHATGNHHRVMPHVWRAGGPPELEAGRRRAYRVWRAAAIRASKLESIFRELEQVESAQPKTSTAPGLGLDLAVVACSIEQLGGQLRVDSKVEQESRLSFLIPFPLWDKGGSGQKVHQSLDMYMEDECSFAPLWAWRGVRKVHRAKLTFGATTSSDHGGRGVHRSQARSTFIVGEKEVHALC
jgi:hypothetical protein